MKKKALNSRNIPGFIYLLCSILSGVALSVSSRDTDKIVPLWLGVTIGVIIAVVFIALGKGAKSFTIKNFSRVSVGLLLGVIAAWSLNKISFAELIASLLKTTQIDAYELAVSLFLYSSLCYLGVFFAFRSNREDLALVIPYVRFRQKGSNARPLLLDVSAVVDGRLISLVESGFLSKELILPRYILDELQVLANSPSSGKRESGERTLNALEQLKSNASVELEIYDDEKLNEDQTHNVRLVTTVKNTNARLITTDETITKSARLQSVDVINLDELTNALRPPITVGEKLKLNLTREGKEDHQAVGYLSDGSMIVVNQAAKHIGTLQTVVVVSKLQTSSGLMVFADLDQ